FRRGLDPAKLALGGTVLSFVISPFAAPVYNLPIFLFGNFAQESSDAVQSLKVFSGLLSASIVFDLIWMINNEQNGFVRFLTILLWLLKIPTAIAFLTALRQRGSQFMGIGDDVHGPTVWSMPGGFTSGGREGYQTVGDEPRAPPPPRTNIVAPVPQPAPGVQPGGYQNV
ncbi:hypothetical protein BU15DRAFT_44980, partial [Melanogaster broomeanus]